MRRSYPDAQACIRLYRIQDSNARYIGIQVPKDPIIERLVSGQEGVSFSAQHRMYVLKEQAHTVRQFLDRFRGKIWVNISHLRTYPEGQTDIRAHSIPHSVLAADKLEALDRLMVDLEVLRYRPSTIKQYRSALLPFLKYFNHRPLESLEMEDVIEYNKVMIIDQGKSVSAQKQLTGGLKHLFERVVKGQIDSRDLEYARRSNFLPTVLNKEEVIAMSRCARNDKHRMIILILYAQGLRRQELLDLKLKDIDISRAVIHVRQGKGAKDRIVPMSKVLMGVLRSYLAAYRPEEYLLNGQNSLQYSGTSVGRVVSDTAKRAGIKKRVTPHTLRHSYATHCLELGLGLRYIQDFLGHWSVKTTMRYTHIRNNKTDINPLDALVSEYGGGPAHNSSDHQVAFIIPNGSDKLH
ncbi:MAG: tyrosine-type recombinase/integrase [Flavobacteriales bacterium]|nr:tyrosine-type recombinase/integrase [Flavobacteriales bacterium]